MAEINSKEKQGMTEAELHRQKLQLESNNLVQKEWIVADVRRE